MPTNLSTFLGSTFAGLQGNQGVQGLQGLQGRQGTQGVQGLQGTQGVQGLQGTQGVQGLSNQGTQGVQGLSGTNAGQGAQGVQGVQGLQGLQGVQGLSNQGTQGVQGLSNQGTQGVQGLQGTQGVQGLQGTQGVQGLQGLQGVQGLQGMQGRQGTQGVQGLSNQGAQGVQGPSGGGGSLSVNDDTATTTPLYVALSTATSGTVGLLTVSSSKFTFIPSSGSLGIGTTSPTSNLDVLGNVKVSGVSTFTANVSFGSSALFNSNKSIVLGNGSGDDLLLYSTTNKGIVQYLGTGILEIWGKDVNIKGANGTETLAAFSENTSASLYFNNVKEFETTGYGATVFGILQTQGYFSSGVGTISVNTSTDALRITQTGAGNALVVEDSTNPDATPFVVDATGSVGIGTTIATALLTVKPQSVNDFVGLFSGTTNNDLVRITQDGTGNALRVDDQAGGTTPFIVDNVGKVGINTQTATSNLTVFGSGRITGITTSQYLDGIAIETLRGSILAMSYYMANP